MLENGFTNRGLDKFLRIFLANPHSKMIFLGIEMNTARKNILDEINKYRTTKTMPNSKRLLKIYHTTRKHPKRQEH